MALIESVENIKSVIPVDLLKTFKLPYANTNHSAQGLTLEKEYTIFDMNINREWCWVSLTRTDD